MNIKDIDRTIETLDKILNRYNSAYNSSTWLKDIAVESGIQLVIDSIRYKMEKEWEKWN